MAWGNLCHRRETSLAYNGETMDETTVNQKLNAAAKRFAAMSPADRHQFKIAKDTLRMTDAGASIMGGMSKDQARQFLRTYMKWTEGAIARLER